MLKKISVIALAGLLALPALANAGSSTTNDVAAQIDRLTKELADLKAQMANMKENQVPSASSKEIADLKAQVQSMKEDQDEAFDDLEERTEAWDLSSRFNFYGDFRSRVDFNTAESPAHYTALDVATGVNTFEDMAVGDAAGFPGTFGTISGILTGAGLPLTGPQMAAMGGILAPLTPGTITIPDLVGLMKAMTPAQRVAVMGAMGINPHAQKDYDNDSIYTNRFRLNMRVKATENVEFKARLAMYKAWGMQNNPVDYNAITGGGGPHYLSSSMSGFDGASTRQPSDSALRVDRAFVNWNNIGGQPIWFSVGRRPTSDGPPAQLRLGVDQRMATPVNFMDYPFDGLSIGYAYTNLLGVEDMPGRVRFCYGRGFESGPTEDGNGMKDVDFAGLSWDVYKSGNRFLNIQSFAGLDMFNVPDGITFPNPLEYDKYKNDANYTNTADFVYDVTDSDSNLILDRQTMGNIYHTSMVFMDKIESLNYFFSAGWSRTDPRGVDEIGTGLLSSWWDEPQSKDGYSVYAGIRYDVPDSRMKLGLEYNYGTKNWIAFTPGHDDMYQSKLATRGSVYEAYMIYDLPTGEALSKYAKTFLRLGFQHYDYEYTGSGFWLGEPVKITDVANDPLYAQFYSPIDEMQQIYLSLDVFF